MAEYAKESTQYITSDSDEDTPEGLLPDSLGLLVQELYTEASSDGERTNKEEIWQSAWHAMRGEFPDVVSKAVEIAKERGIYVNLTKRIVHEARTKLMSSTFQQGKIPFKITPSRRPKFMSPDVLRSDSPYDEATIRAKNCELRKKLKHQLFFLLTESMELLLFALRIPEVKKINLRFHFRLTFQYFLF